MNLAEFLSGISMATFAACGVFFLKFWRASHDRFYLLFSAACWLIAAERVALFLVDDAHHELRSAVTESTSWVFSLRLAAYLMILFAIIGKNRKLKGAPAEYTGNQPVL
jgi:hypothetical protein